MTPARRPRPRTAEQIGRTRLGPRPVPALAATGRMKRSTSAERLLDNGSRVIAVRKPGTPLVELRLRIPFAGRTEQHTARAELLAETVVLGTAELDREQVDELLADVGGHLDAGVDPQRLVFSGSVLANGLPVLLGMLADTLTGAAYRAADVAGERDRLVEHLGLTVAQPGVVARMALQHRRFGDHPAARDLPTADRVAGVTAAAVRGLHRRAVLPAGSTLVLVGDLSPKRAVDLAAAVLAGWTGTRPAAVLPTPPSIVGGPLLAVHRRGSVQSQVRLTADAPDRSSPDYTAFQIANLVYGGYFSSRLVENIREDKGYTYGAGSGIEFWPGRAAVTVSFDTTTASTAAALLEARYELGRLALTPPKDAEVESARNYALGTLALSLATQSGLASMLATLHGVGLDAGWLREHPARLSAVTAVEVAAAAARYLAPAAFTGVVVGDLDVIGDALARSGGVELP